jgi:hypothetical protein
MLPIIAAGAAGLMAAKGLYDAYSNSQADARTREAMKQQLQRMVQGSDMYERYRPKAASAHAQILDAQQNQYIGANQALQTMYGHNHTGVPALPPAAPAAPAEPQPQLLPAPNGRAQRMRDQELQRMQARNVQAQNIDPRARML